MRMLGDLGGMIGQMTPEAQKRNLHRIFTRIELNDQEEAVRVEVKPWVMRAFEPMLGSTPVYRTYYAEGGSRTHTPVGERDFESRASASSATSALLSLVQYITY